MKPFKWNWDAEDYAKNSSAQMQWAQELIEKLALNGSESIIDIGCGDGKISVMLAEHVKDGKVVGIDLSENMVRHATGQFAASNRNLTFLNMDAININLSEKFDIAFSNAVLHWVKDHAAVLRGVRACLKTGGRILFQMGGRGNAEEIFAVIREVRQRLRWRGYFENFVPPYYFYGPEEYESWLSESGFRPARVELIPKDMKHNGAEGLKGWLRTTGFPFTDCLPVDLRNAFLDDVIEAYIAMNPVDAFGNTHVKMVRLEVEAYAL